MLTLDDFSDSSSGGVAGISCAASAFINPLVTKSGSFLQSEIDRGTFREYV